MKTKIKWDKRRVRTFIIFAVLTLVSYQGYLHLGIFLPKAEYTRQFAGLFSIVFLLLTFNSLRKLFPKALTKGIKDSLRKALKKVTDAIEKVLDKLRDKLGFPDKASRLKGKDEKSFIFSRGDKNTDKKKNIQKLKWRDLETNEDRIRFIYVKFIEKFRKKGYKYSTISTPVENGAKWKLSSDDGSGIFYLYTGARYSGGRRAVTDDEVEKSMDLVGIKK